MENLEILISVAGTLVGLFITSITFIAKFLRAIKMKNIEQAQNLLSEAAAEAVAFVEQVKSKANGELDGKTKKIIALTRINQVFIEKGIPFNHAQADLAIEKIVALTKKVNSKTINLNYETDNKEQYNTY